MKGDGRIRSWMYATLLENPKYAPEAHGLYAGKYGMLNEYKSLIEKYVSFANFPIRCNAVMGI